MRYPSLGAFLRLASTAQLAFGAAVFNWPDPLLDTLDDQLYRPFFSPASTFALNCNPRDNSTIAAQWLRLAYHDMATHNATTGTGGMDASIAFEFTRPQDVGVGMIESLVDFLVAPNEYVGMADVIAMGAINAVIGCGGPVIPYRGGRVDATEAGPATVPEPQQDLASHIASFQAQGFNQTEMIMLVACGHSLGGVRQVDFPLIVTDDVPAGIQTFASTLGFDNTIVHEYLNGTTENVLVVGSNVTTRSDLRIFSSDNNVTMQSLASSDTFNTVCADLIGRMIDTVPSTVTLTDVIEPLDYKVWNTLLFPQGGSLAFLATLRIIHTGTNPTVTMFWKERTGSFCPPQGCSIGTFQVTNVDSSFLASLKGVDSFDLHSFNASVDLTTSISYFWFEVNHNDGSAPFVVDNNGKNYTIDQDVLLFDPRRSSFTIAGLEMVVGVKDPSGTTNVTALSTLTGSTEVPVTSSTTITFTLDPSWPPADGYTFYTSPISGKASSNTIHATVNGTAYSLWVPFLDAPGV
ncbi:Peroxidase [Mycena sanguinolenta]|uniref:Peroxidase n=1 Tax=Mycena sanguinolenta TaxID=230812 RepID=A0A8H7CNS9_9AGAR|nr:Peroxidase [Mycena sanguinolenta]